MDTKNALPAISDVAYHLLEIVGRTTRPFTPGEARKAVRAAIVTDCRETSLSRRMTQARDRLVKQGYLEVKDGRWISTDAGRAEAAILNRLNDSPKDMLREI